MSETIRRVELSVVHPWADTVLWVDSFDGFEAARQHIAKMREAYRVLGFGEAPDVIFTVRFKGSDITPAEEPTS